MQVVQPLAEHGPDDALRSTPPPSPKSPIASHILMLSLTVACIVMALGAIFLASLQPHNSDDYLVQAKTGQIIAQSGRIPHTDPFSWTVHDSPWVVHGWLATVLFYVMASHLPLWMALVYKGGLASLACGLLLCRARIRSGSWFLSIGVALLAGFALPGWANVRPEMLTLVLFAALLLGLDLYGRGRARFLPFLLPVVFVLWANVHPSVAIGLVLVLTWVFGEWVGRRDSEEKRSEMRPLVLGLVASAVAIGLNPEGFGLYAYPLRMLFRPVMTDHLTEWSSPDFHVRTVQCFEVLLLGTPVAMALAGRQRGWSVGDALLLVVMAVAALLYSRDVAPFSIAIAPIFAGALAMVTKSLSLPTSIHAIAQRPALRQARAAAFMVLLALLAYKRLPRNEQGRVPPGEWASYTLGLDVFPQAGATFLASGQCPGRLFNDYDWGGYLIWRLWPMRQVFIDRRAEIYDKGRVFKDRLLIESGRPGWQEALDRWGVQVVLTHRRSNLYRALLQSPTWHLVFSGDVEDIHVRAKLR